MRFVPFELSTALGAISVSMAAARRSGSGVPAAAPLTTSKATAPRESTALGLLLVGLRGLVGLLAVLLGLRVLGALVLDLIAIAGRGVERGEGERRKDGGEKQLLHGENLRAKA